MIIAYAIYVQLNHAENHQKVVSYNHQQFSDSSFSSRLTVLTEMPATLFFDFQKWAFLAQLRRFRRLTKVLKMQLGNRNRGKASGTEKEPARLTGEI